MFISATSGILYPLWTGIPDSKYRQTELNEIEKIDIENKLLKKQIENRELMKKLNEYN